MMKLTPIALLSLLGDCDAVADSTPVAGITPFTGFASINQPIRVGPFVVTPIKVMEDSRCPINAR